MSEFDALVASRKSFCTQHLKKGKCKEELDPLVF